MPLKGIKIIELAGLAPVPFCGQILGDFGAKVTRIDNVFNSMEALTSFKYGKESINLNLKNEKGSKILQKIVQNENIDVFIDPFRPGVLEKMKLGPNDLMSLNPKLIYTRLSGFGQTGKMKFTAGHDINYVATSGVLSFLCSNKTEPKPPVNLLADFAGGSILCSLGIMIALFERTKSGKGQIIDHSMTEGTAYISSFLFETLKNQKELFWPKHPEAGTNLLDGGAPFYRCYETKDKKFISVGAIETKFYDKFIEVIGFDDPDGKYIQFDNSLWPEMCIKFGDIIRTKTRDEWTKLFENVDACVTPVLEVSEVMNLEQHKSRNAFENDLPNPAPILSRTPAKRDWNISEKTITRDVLQRLGYSSNEIDKFENDQIVS